MEPQYITELIVCTEDHLHLRLIARTSHGTLIRLLPRDKSANCRINTHKAVPQSWFVNMDAFGDPISW